MSQGPKIQTPPILLAGCGMLTVAASALLRRNTFQFYAALIVLGLLVAVYIWKRRGPNG